jgi:FtsP/CotA-like multicopper oxidase with cupredoxin domain/plastocyanin
MADVEFWIQIESNPWDVAPHNVDRLTGQTIQQITGQAPIVKTLISPVTGVVQTRTMFKPLSQDALFLRRYTPNWAAPDDRKVNPWDLNEPDPTDNGTMGTIPGAVIECNVGDKVIVHFRNHDTRSGKALKARIHSLHPHGFVFAPTSDGAFPLSPPDPSQPVGAEAADWATVGVSGLKKGDRVPPGGTFIYTWQTFGWPTTAGVWLYHDHSICDMENVQQGAIGIVVIRNPSDPEDDTDLDLPGGSFNGLPTFVRCFPPPFPVPILPHDLDTLGLHGNVPHSHGGHFVPTPATVSPRAHPAPTPAPTPPDAPLDTDAPVPTLIAKHGDLLVEFDPELTRVARLCLPFYRPPPAKARYLQLFHNLGDAAMCINGRKYLGNTPTLIAGVNTRMRFGLVGMGNVDGFHTFHLHGHRWIVPGPDGNTLPAIQGSAQVKAVSQFEDTRTFGPANSFTFKINQGSFMGSFFTPDPTQAPGLGEWHMHCHVLTHMMDGMMGSLLVIKGGEIFTGLPVGEPCPADTGGGGLTVAVRDFEFFPKTAMVSAGQTVTWNWEANNHSTTSDTGVWDSGVQNSPHTFTHTFTAADSGKTFPYFCSQHGGPGGTGMSGSIMVM